MFRRLQWVTLTFVLLYYNLLRLVSLQNSHFVRVVVFHRLHLSLKMLPEHTKFTLKLLDHSAALHQLLL